MSYYDPDSPPPPPTESASFKQIIMMFGFGTLGSIWVIRAIQSQPGNALGIGAVLIMFALIFFAGLISRNQIVELVASGALVLGASILVVMTIMSRDVLWGVGAVFFVLCIVVIQMKHRFVDKSPTPDGEMKNPYH